MFKRLLLLFCCVLVALCALFFGYRLVEKSRHPLLFHNHILAASQLFDVEPSLIASVINVESSFNPYAVSPKGAVGLMQLLPSTASWLASKINLQEYNNNMLTDPQTNILLGTSYLRYLLDKFERWQTALCAYNAGEGVVSTWLQNANYSQDGATLSKIPFAETEAHLQKISDNLKVYQKWI